MGDTKLLVYYLDDEPDICENFVDQFSSDLISIKSFQEPQALISAIKLRSPDLIFIDYRLPGQSGDVVAQSISLKVPIFLVSGDLHLSYKYPFAKIFNKPFVIKDIQATLLQYLKKTV